MKYRSELLYEYAKEHIRDEDVPPVFVPSYNRPDAAILRRLLVEPEFPIVLCIRREQAHMYEQWMNKCSVMLLDGVSDIAETRREIELPKKLNSVYGCDKWLSIDWKEKRKFPVFNLIHKHSPVPRIKMSVQDIERIMNEHRN